MGFDKEAQYPLLIIDSASSEIPSADLSGTNEILNFITKLSFIGEYQSHSAKEKQTLNDFIKPVVSPFFQNMLRNSMKSRYFFYSKPKHFKQAKYDREFRFFTIQYYWKLKKTLWHPFEEIESEN